MKVCSWALNGHAGTQIMSVSWTSRFGKLRRTFADHRLLLVRHRDFTRHLLAPRINSQQHDNDGAHQRATRQQK
jgi:hypothetical protein